MRTGTGEVGNTLVVQASGKQLVTSGSGGDPWGLVLRDWHRIGAVLRRDDGFGLPCVRPFRSAARRRLRRGISPCSCGSC